MDGIRIDKSDFIVAVLAIKTKGARFNILRKGYNVVTTPILVIVISLVRNIVRRKGIGGAQLADLLKCGLQLAVLIIGVQRYILRDVITR